MKSEPNCLQIFPAKGSTKPNNIEGQLSDPQTQMLAGDTILNKTQVESTILKMKKEDCNYLAVENTKHYQRTSWFKLEMVLYCCF